MPVVEAVVVHAEGVEILSGPLGEVDRTSVPGAPGRYDQLFIPLPQVRSDGIIEYATELPDGSLQQVTIDPDSASVVARAHLSPQPALMTEVPIGTEATAGVSLVMHREGDSGFQYGIWDTAAQNVLWLEDSDFTPLAPYPDGGFLVSRVPGTLRLTADGQTIDAGYGDLPSAWSAAFGPNQLLAIGTTSNEVIIAEPSGAAAPVADLPSGSAIDLTWDNTGTVLLVNLAVASDPSTSGIYGCDLTSDTCHQILDYEPDLRLATDTHSHRFQ